MTMRILHISHGILPDARIERNAMTMEKRGNVLHFLGGSKLGLLSGNPTVSKQCPPFVSMSEAYYGSDLLMLAASRFWQRQIKRIDPDIIHAHDLLACRMTFGLDYPVVYDDHEWWTRNFPIWYHMRGKVRKLLTLPTLLAIPRWERRALTTYPTLTVSEPIAESHRREYGGRVGVTPNYPSLAEVEGLKADNSRSGSVYLGSDVVARVGAKRYSPYRDPTGLPSEVKYDRLHGFSYRDMMRHLTAYRIGLIPWNCHPLHHYACPAKAFDYLHAGLQVIAPETMTLLKGHPYVTLFKDLKEIPSLISSLPDVSPASIMAHARRQHIWENQEPIILDAYEEAIQ